MSGVEAAKDWQHQSLSGLAGLNLERVPGAEILFLDALAAHLLGPGAPVAPYTIEHGTVVVGHLLRAMVDSRRASIECPVEVGEEGTQAREAIVEGAHLFAERGGPGVQQLVSRFLAAAVGELEIHAESAEEQTRSLFYYGLLAVASGPDNRLTQAAADGIMEIFGAWNDAIGAGFVPPWRVVSPA